MITLTIFCFLVTLLIIVVKRYYDRGKGMPPGPTPFPLLGNIPMMDAHNPQKTIAKWAKIYGPVLTIWFPDPIVMITDLELMKKYYINKGDIFAGRPFVYIETTFRKGKYGLVMSEGPLWQEHRRFALKVLRDLGFGKNLMQEKILNEVEKAVEFLKDSKGVPQTPLPMLTTLVGNVISGLVLGHTYENGDPEFAHMKELLSEMMLMFTNPAIVILEVAPWTRFIPGLRQLGHNRVTKLSKDFVDYLSKFVEKNKDEFSESEMHHPSNYIMAYLAEIKRRKESGEEPGTFDTWQLLMNLADLWAAGLETTVTTLQWAILFMVVFPDIQEKVQQEIKDNISTDKDYLITMDDKMKLPYTSAVICEIQRRANILPINVWRSTLQNTEMEGYKIPKDTKVIAQISAALSDEEAFPEPDKFDPERFLEVEQENGGKKVSLKKIDHFLPFSLGKRQCLGENLAKMELFLIFANLVKAFHLKPKNGHKYDLTPKAGFTLVPQEYECIFEETIVD